MRIIFLANVDWFFQSHFLYLARRARADGWRVALAAQFESDRRGLLGEQVELIELPTRRGRLGATQMMGAAALVARELARQPHTLLHGFGLFGITVGAVAMARSGVRRSVFTITGRGYAAVAPTLKARAVRIGARHLCAQLADGPNVRWLAENASDLEACGLSRAVRQSRTAIVGGAGIDPELYAATPMPPRSPLKVALVARMIWSKGIDTAVEAVRIARQRGAAVELTLAGGVDSDNPRAFDVAQLRDFESKGGVTWLGRVENIDELWSRHHVAVLPSRGGEGVPKALIEAAACGRPIATASVPGCREFAEATGGWHVAPDCPQALAELLIELAQRDDLATIGMQARSVVLQRYTHEHNWKVTAAFYNELMRGAAGGARDQASGAGMNVARR